MPMTQEKLLSAFDACQEILAHNGFTTAERDSESPPGTNTSFYHLVWMSVEGRKLAEAERREKAMRWLGFLQGALFWSKLATVDDLKDMNRPDKSTFDKKRV